MRALSVLILFAMVMGCAGGAATEKQSTMEQEMAPEEMEGHTFTQHYENSLFEVTEQGLYSIELVVKAEALFVGNNSMDVIVHDREDHDVKGAAIEIKPWMPGMGHGVSEVPKITERGGGLYTAEMVHASMPGHWDLHITVNAGSGTDSAVFTFPNVEMREGMEMGGMEQHRDMEEMSEMGMTGMQGSADFSKSITSKNGLFTVSYEAQYDPIPVGNIHEWRLDIADKDGNPVEGAEIEVSGEMPAHGHGLPTKPEATPEGGGLYLIEGMDFSMPGYWTVTVKIEKDGVQDSATFNLELK